MLAHTWRHEVGIYYLWTRQSKVSQSRCQMAFYVAIDVHNLDFNYQSLVSPVTPCFYIAMYLVFSQSFSCRFQLFLEFVREKSHNNANQPMKGKVYHRKSGVFNLGVSEQGHTKTKIKVRSETALPITGRCPTRFSSERHNKSLNQWVTFIEQREGN